MLNLDFSQKLIFPHHPRLKHEAEIVLENLKHLSDYILLFSSGTTSQFPKGYGLTKISLTENADSVNRHFNLTSSDTWGLSLPHYHVGGFSVLLRAERSKSRVVDLGKWDPVSWKKKIEKEGVTITTIVPTQLFDLVNLHMTSPPTLKCLIVGGDYLSEELRARALKLNYPVLKTFGMTEVGSQLASQKTPEGPLELLDIYKIKIDKDERLWVKTPSLFDFEFTLSPSFEIEYARDLLDSEGFFPTKDRALMENNHLTHLGRLDDYLKISGRLVSLFELKEKLYAFALKHNLYQKVEIKIEEDPRIGKKIILLHLPGTSLPPDLLSPFSFEAREVNAFERTDLGKLKNG
jgi:O-succinylbenzoic acid--CoA ligase